MTLIDEKSSKYRESRESRESRENSPSKENVNREPGRANDASASASIETLTSLPLLNLNAGRESILAYFENTWALTEMLFSALTSDEAFYVRPYHKTRHPLIFYFAHPVCFYVNKLLVSGLTDQPINQELELLFETGVDEMNWDDLHNGEQDLWPAVDEVRVYRAEVYELVKSVIKNHPALNEDITIQSPAWALLMAFEHERIHLETSSVLIREMPIEYVTTPSQWPAYLNAPQQSNGDGRPQAGQDYPASNPLLEVPKQDRRLGKPETWPSFGWDNEYGVEKHQVTAFRASKCLISNGEFYEFVTAGGYETEKYWSEDAWAWRQFRNIKWPTFWEQDGPSGSHRYRLRTTFTVIDMQWSWPAIVNYFEAKAYCAWLTEQREQQSSPYRLLRESEHQALRDSQHRASTGWTALDQQGGYRDPVMEAQTSAINHNLRYGSESAVDGLSANAEGFHDVFGNVWQWCEDPFHPLPEFKIHPYYTDFSTPCFDGKHQMILGGSFISTGDEASIWARFHFRPHFFQNAGFRLVQSIESEDERSDKYESDELVNQYLLFHFGAESEQQDAAIAAKNGHPQTANLVLRTTELMKSYAGDNSSALDLGCAVGRASFELSRSFTQVVGVDYSKAFVDVAKVLKKSGELSYQRRETGRHYTKLKAAVDAGINRDRVAFMQGDAMELDKIIGLSAADNHRQPYSAILLSNLLCRLSNPARCLKQFTDSNSYLKSGGILVIASPNTWLQQYTPVERFIDGADTEATISQLGQLLKGFELLHEEDLPFMIREHRRKYQYIVSQVTVWRKS